MEDDYNMVDNKEIRLYTLGDSHAWHCWLNIPWVETTHLGPMTMYIFGNAKTIVANKIPEGKPYCLSYGEVDCRYHVFRHQPWKDTIDELVKNYLKIIDLNAEINPNVFLFNVVPPPRRDHLENPEGNTAFPFYGSDAERLQYANYMNTLLKSQDKYPVIDIYNLYCDKDGFLNMEQSDGHVHIKGEQPLMEYVDKILKEKGL